jgi:alkanesulfonate monooxygenase SsuD/methylene tetrahydromethanopterin reductase-like flavin-dependent oxidoreductase (luciferase family)
MGYGAAVRSLIDLAVRYADGFTTVIPNAFATPERFAREVRRMKRELETLGRDPEKFDFAIWGAALVHDDEETVAKTLDNPLVRWITAAFGRPQPAGLEGGGASSPSIPTTGITPSNCSQPNTPPEEVQGRDQPGVHPP